MVMENSALQFWMIFGVVLIFGEVILPGLVSVFVGLGALTVAVFIHYQIIDSIPSQLVTWFLCSTVYIFTLRLLVMKYYPSDTKKQGIDEDQMVVGQEAEVTEAILAGQLGRVAYGDTTWKATSQDKEDIQVGEKVKLLKRDNITWLVERAKQGEE